MKMRYALLAAILFLFPSFAQAQQDALETARRYLSEHPQQYGLSEADLADVVVSSQYTDAHNGVTHLYLVQRHAGIEVYNGVLNVHLKDGEVLLAKSRFVSKLAARVRSTTPALPPEMAVQAVARALDLPLTEPLVLEASKGGPAQEVTLSPAGISLDPIPARLVYQPMPDGTVRLAWRLEIYELDQQHYWRALVDAETGEVLLREDLVTHDDFGYLTPQTDLPNWRESAALRARLIEKYRAEKARLHGAPAAAPRRTNDGLYEVYPIPFESPSHAAGERFPTADLRQIVTESDQIAKAGPLAATNGWHNDGGGDYTTTRGNNVFAHLDSLGTEAGPSPDDGLSRDFTTNNPNLTAPDYSLDLTRQPSAYGPAAVVNLFYMNNVMHDVFYQYGFNEQSGNLQRTNFGRGGLENDLEIAQAQDGGGQNNANQLTLQDGVPGRMQMFLWTPPSGLPPVLINAPANIAGVKPSFQAAFGPAPNNETADLVLAQKNANAAGLPDEGCGLNAGAAPSPLPYANAAAVSGKIALVKRGTCSFIEKVLSAQLSGAIGVIVYTHNPGQGPLVMGCTAGCEAAVIPSAMVGNLDGLAIRAEVDAAVTVNATLRRDPNPLPFRDGDFDNGIIAHEYHHAISTRLVGGPNNACLGGTEQGGEGWSDWAALMLTMKGTDTRTAPRGIGNYAIFADPFTGGGIRPAPYSTDFGVNDFTYSDLQNAGGSLTIPHGVGFVWATMMWEFIWDLIDRDGFDPDLYSGSGGNNLAMQLIVDGMKMTPCSPTFVDMRDGIIAAAEASTDQATVCTVWEAFARRGLGYGAQASVFVDNFDLPPECAPQLRLTKAVDKEEAVAGEVLTYALTALNELALPLSGVTITDPIPNRVTYVDGSVQTGGGCNGAFDAGTNTITFSPGALSGGASLTCSYQVRINGGVHSPVLFTDAMDTAANWTSTSDVPAVTWTHFPASPDAHSLPGVWFARDFDTDNNQYLTQTVPLTLPAADPGDPTGSSGTPVLTFWHKFHTELGFDGGFVEITDDGGLNWNDLGGKMTKNGYNGSFFNGDSCAEFPDHEPEQTPGQGCYIQTSVDLTVFAGRTVQLRFRMFTDLLLGDVGWYVDDVEIVDQGCIDNAASATSVELPGPFTAFARTCVTNLTPNLVDVDAKVVLEGPYESATNFMNTALNGGGHLPTSQPYADAFFDGTPMDYDGTEGVGAGFFANNPEIVDWVLVELRTSADAGDTVARRAAFLKRDGSIVDLDCVSPVAFVVPVVQDHFVVVRHRNHLPVMSAAAVALSGSTLTHDFTTGQGQAFGAQPMQQLEPGVFGLYAGDFDGNGQVQTSDKNNLWRAEVGLAGYKASDANLNGQVQNDDKNNYWRPNSGKGSQID